MRFHNIFSKGVEEANRRLRYDSQIQRALVEYDGRKVVINVTDDAIYVFTISSNGITYTYSPSAIPDDMYVETDSEIMNELIQGRINAVRAVLLRATGRIKTKRIRPKEINLIRKLLGR
jgi:hypothetical protein